MRNRLRNAFTPDPIEEEQSDELDPPRPFLEHFVDLRNMFVRMAIAWFVCVLAVTPFSPWVLRVLQYPLESQALIDAGVHVQGLGLGIGATVFIKIMMWGGTICSLPFIFYFLLQFIFPGLRRHERNLLLFTLGAGVTLFSAGVWMCFSFTLQIGMEVLMAINRWMGLKVEILQAEDYFSLVLKTIFAFGLAFQLPLILLVLGWVGLISSETLREKRSISIVMIFVLAMFLTPPEPVSQIVMAVPMCLLYELCIILIRMKERLDKKGT